MYMHMSHIYRYIYIFLYLERTTAIACVEWLCLCVTRCPIPMFWKLWWVLPKNIHYIGLQDHCVIPTCTNACGEMLKFNMNMLNWKHEKVCTTACKYAHPQLKTCTCSTKFCTCSTKMSQIRQTSLCWVISFMPKQVTNSRVLVEFLCAYAHANNVKSDNV